MTDVEDALTGAFRDEWSRVVAAVIRITGDWSLAEDCAQDAFATAAVTWPRDGVPDRPGAWLTTAARRRALDRLRRAGAEQRRLAQVVTLAPPGAAAVGAVAGPAAEVDESATLPDDRLALIATCCHPALAQDVQVALTLRTVCGMPADEIARAWGVTEAAMAKRLVRGRRKIADAGIPYRVPPADRLPERLDGVLAVVYLTFNAGYTAGAGADPERSRLADEAVRLARLVAGLVPDDPETHGLLALVLLQDARRPARTDAAGDLVPLEEQDRTRWDADRTAAGLAALADAERLVRAGGRRGAYLVQARVAAEHARAASVAATDWTAVAGHYADLVAVAPSPFAELGRAVAVAMADGPDAGLRVLAAVAPDPRLRGNPYVAATRADLLRRAGRTAEAADEYRVALALVTDATERRYLRRRLDEMSPGAG